jgi:ATP-dependent RNA helicase DeaD
MEQDKNEETGVIELAPEIKKALDELGFTQMTEVQRKTIPAVRTGADVVVKAPTGTGKTFAFGIPIVEGIDRESDRVQVMILAPTRELATQINTELRKLTAFTEGVRTAVVYGGQPIEKQIAALKKRPQIVVGTPGRILDHMGRHTIKTDAVRCAVLDEADKMLDMGFFKDVTKILDKLPKEKQLCLFSATITREVMDIMWLYQRDAIEITVAPTEGNEPKIKQYSIFMQRQEKMRALFRILDTYKYDSVIVFCNTKRMTERACRELRQKGYDAEALSSDVNQRTRMKIMDSFKAHTLRILVATDVAARGIDVSDVEAVINYDMPDDNTYYLHRIGRTGRARKEGVSYVFYDATEYGRLKDIIKYTHSDIIPMRFNAEGKLEKAE